MFFKFENRKDAGHQLAKVLTAYAGKPDTLVMALPRGGVPVAYEVAQSLSLPLDVWLVRKLGVPGHEELAMGALALNGAYHINRDVAISMDVPYQLIGQVIASERAELTRRNKLYRQGQAAPSLRGKTVIVVDDGLATGATMHAAVESLRHAGSGHIVVAAPVGSESACAKLKSVADEVICLHKPETFDGVGQWYRDFSQTGDAEVLELLRQRKIDNCQYNPHTAVLE